MPDNLRTYTYKVLIFLALTCLLLLAVQLSKVLLLVFGGVVVAAVLLSLVRLVQRFTPLGHGTSLTIVLLALTVGLYLLLRTFGTQVSAQLMTLIVLLPDAWENAQTWLDGVPFGAMVHEQLDTLRDNFSRIASTAGALAINFTSGLVELFLVIVGGIYLAAQPKLYRDGLLKLFPKRERPMLGDAVNVSGNALRLWLGGQIIVMAVVGALTGIGLYFLGVPAAFALALIAFLLDFVPIIGPVVAAIPGILLGLTVSPAVGLATLVLYVVLQQIESNVLQPLVQQKAVKLPPALLLFSLFAFGALYGVPGMILAAPLTVFLYVLVKKIYVQDILHTTTPIPGRDDGESAAAEHTLQADSATTSQRTP